MYLDIQEKMDMGVFRCEYDIAIRHGVDRIKIHAMITSDSAVFTGDGEIC
jgi:hypothetical protein